jgi:ketosteroid isomerase-like protein
LTLAIDFGKCRSVPETSAHNFMSRILIIALLIVATAILYGAELNEGKSDHKSKLEKEVLKIEKEWADAILRLDAKTIDRLEADEWTITDPTGKFSTKAEDLKNLMSGKSKFQSFRNEEMKVKVYGKAATVTGLSAIKGTFDGNDITGRYRFLDVLVKKDGTWKAVATQVTRVSSQ